MVEVQRLRCSVSWVSCEFSVMGRWTSDTCYRSTSQRYTHFFRATTLLFMLVAEFSCDYATHSGYPKLLYIPTRRRRYAVTKRRQILESECILHILKTHHRLLLRSTGYSWCSLIEDAL